VISFLQDSSPNAIHIPPPRAACPAQLILDFIALNKVWRTVHLMKLFIRQFSRASSSFLALIVTPSPPWCWTPLFCHLSHDLAGVFLTNMAQARVTACLLSTEDRHKTSNLPVESCAYSSVHIRDSEGNTSSIFGIEHLWRLTLWFSFETLILAIQTTRFQTTRTRYNSSIL
jgi:hypothetical protein